MEAVFLKLVNMSLTASWLVLAVVAFRILFKNSPKYIRVILWGFVALRLIFPFSIESIFSIIPSSEPLPTEFLYAATPQVNTGIPVLNDTLNPILSQSLTPTPGASANPSQIWSFIFSQVWILGMVLMAMYALISYLVVKRKVGASIKISDNIRLCDHIESPFILGLFKPVIYLPSELDAQTADLVLEHENAHLERNDHWWKPLGFALLCVYWFNPVMWLAYALLCRDIELACDEKVIHILGHEEKKAYSSALLRCSVNRRMIAACPLAFGEVGVKNRIKSILNYRKPAFWVMIAAVVICIAIALCFLTDPLNKIDPLTLEDWGITITARDPSPTGVTLAIKIPDNLDGSITIPSNQVLLKLQDGEWVEVPPIVPAEDVIWDFFKNVYPDYEAEYQKVEWEIYYGAVPPGEYRIKKPLWLYQDGMSYQKDFDVDFVISESADISTSTENDFAMTILGAQHYSNGISLQLQVTFPEFIELDQRNALYGQDVILTYATKTGVSTANVYHLNSLSIDPELHFAVYDMRFSFSGQDAPTGKEFRLSISGFGSTQGTEMYFTTPLSLTWQADVEDAEILEYKQGDTHLRLAVSPVVIHITANGTDFATMDALYDALTVLDLSGNRMDTGGSYGGSQGGTLINMEILPQIPIDVDQIGEISIGEYVFTRRSS